MFWVCACRLCSVKLWYMSVFCVVVKSNKDVLVIASVYVFVLYVFVSGSGSPGTQYICQCWPVSNGIKIEGWIGVRR